MGQYTLWAVDRATVKEVEVVERDWRDTPVRQIPLSPECHLLVRERWGRRQVMRLSCRHLFRSEADAKAAVAGGVTGWMPEPRYQHPKRKATAGEAVSNG